MTHFSTVKTEELPDQVACLLIPMHSSSLLLPNEAVAEVVSDLRPELFPDLPDWHMGYVEWRGCNIPVVSYEQLTDQRVNQPCETSRLIIINTITGNQQTPYYGLLSESAPRLMRVFEKDLQQHENTRKIDQYQVSANGEEAVIPDLDKVEKMLETVSHYHA